MAKCGISLALETGLLQLITPAAAAPAGARVGAEAGAGVGVGIEAAALKASDCESHCPHSHRVLRFFSLVVVCVQLYIVVAVVVFVVALWLEIIFSFRVFTGSQMPASQLSGLFM